MVPLYDISSSLCVRTCARGCMCACMSVDSEDSFMGPLFSCHLLGSGDQSQVTRPCHVHLLITLLALTYIFAALKQ